MANPILHRRAGHDPTRSRPPAHRPHGARSRRGGHCLLGSANRAPRASEYAAQQRRVPPLPSRLRGRLSLDQGRHPPDLESVHPLRHPVGRRLAGRVLLSIARGLPRASRPRGPCDLQRPPPRADRDHDGALCAACRTRLRRGGARRRALHHARAHRRGSRHGAPPAGSRHLATARSPGRAGPRSRGGTQGGRPARDRCRREPARRLPADLRVRCLRLGVPVARLLDLRGGRCATMGRRGRRLCRRPRARGARGRNPAPARCRDDRGRRAHEPADQHECHVPVRQLSLGQPGGRAAPPRGDQRESVLLRRGRALAHPGGDRGASPQPARARDFRPRRPHAPVLARPIYPALPALPCATHPRLVPRSQSDSVRHRVLLRDARRDGPRCGDRGAELGPEANPRSQMGHADRAGGRGRAGPRRRLVIGERLPRAARFGGRRGASAGRWVAGRTPRRSPRRLHHRPRHARAAASEAAAGTYALRRGQRGPLSETQPHLHHASVPCRPDACVGLQFRHATRGLREARRALPPPLDGRL